MTDLSPTPAPNRVVSDDVMRRWRRRRRRLRRRVRRLGDVLLVALVVTGIVVAVRKSSNNGSPATTTKATGVALYHPPADDVKLTNCNYLDYAALAAVTITNHVTKEQSYYVEVTFKDGVKYFASAVVSTTHLLPNGTEKLMASGLSTADPPKHLTCKVTRIDRFG
jgi:hypothetical protein